MRIHSRTLLAEGLGFDTRRALTGLSDLRSGMSPFLSQDGEDAARGIQPAAAGAQASGIQYGGFYETTFCVSVTRPGTQQPVQGQSIVVTRQLLAYGAKNNNVISFSDGNGKELTMSIKNMTAGSPALAVDYEIKVLANTLFPAAPKVAYAWFRLTRLDQKRGARRGGPPTATFGPPPTRATPPTGGAAPATTPPPAATGPAGLPGYTAPPAAAPSTIRVP